MRLRWKILIGFVSLVAAALLAWSWAIGPAAVWRVVTHGTTTVWDHLEYPVRSLKPSPLPEQWPIADLQSDPPTVTINDQTTRLDELFDQSRTLAFVVVSGGEVHYDWYAPGHDAATPSMVFSVSKSIISLMVGAAIEDGHITSVDDPVTAYLPEMAQYGFESLTIQDLLRMDTGLAYNEDDNPFGIHVEFNYTNDLTGDILRLRLLDERDQTFRYKSGDNALLSLALDRAIGDLTLTDYLQTRLWDRIGAEHRGSWVTDRPGGLERSWCCLAITARDLARLGQLVLDRGSWQGDQIVSREYLEASFENAYPETRWPADYADSPLSGYGYQWWLTSDGAYVALGKAGQYLYIDPTRDVVIVRLGEAQGDFSWVRVLTQVAAAV